MKKQRLICSPCLLYFLLVGALGVGIAAPGKTSAQDQTYYVATNGNDVTGDGSALKPWPTITNALDSVSDGATILVRPGTYAGQVRLPGTFDTGVTVRSGIPYQARLRHNATVVTCYYGKGITLEGFDFATAGRAPALWLSRSRIFARNPVVTI